MQKQFLKDFVLSQNIVFSSCNTYKIVERDQESSIFHPFKFNTTEAQIKV